jgi:hypothetical protein
MSITGYAVTPLTASGYIKQLSSAFTVSAVGGNFNTAGQGETVTVSAPNAGDLISLVGTNATILGPGTGPIITFQPTTNAPSFQWAITPALFNPIGLPESISFLNNQHWTDSSPVVYTVNDPFTIVSQAITAALNASTSFLGLVQVANLIDMTTAQFANYNQFAPEVQPGNLPEVILLQANWNFMFNSVNSRTSGIPQNFHLMMTMDKLASVPLNQLKTSVVAALTKKGSVLGLDGLVAGWNAAGAMDDGMPNNNWFKRGRQRFFSTLVIRVQTYMNTVQLGSMA